MSSRKARRKLSNSALTLREESLLENKELGLEDVQEKMNVIFKLLNEYGINSELWLAEYLENCQKNGGVPKDFERFLPWNLSPADKQRLSKETTFRHGNAQFVRSNHGSIFHLEEGGKRTKVDFGSMTAAEFDKLTGLN